MLKTYNSDGGLMLSYHKQDDNYPRSRSRVARSRFRRVIFYFTIFIHFSTLLHTFTRFSCFFMNIYLFFYGRFPAVLTVCGEFLLAVCSEINQTVFVLTFKQTLA